MLLWLGREDPKIVEDAFNYLDQMLSSRCQQVLQKRPDLKIGSSKDWYGQELTNELSMLGPADDPAKLVKETATAVTRLLSRPVFHRGWVLQEFVLAKSLVVHWNHANVDAEPLCMAAGLVEIGLPVVVPTADLEPFSPDFLLHFLFIARSNQHTLQQSPTFLSNLTNAVRPQFKDPWDIVYGSLALRSLECRPRETFIKPDYEVSPMAVYPRVAERYLVQHKNLEVLQHVGHVDSIGEWPSWVPNWQQPGLSTRQITSARGHYNASITYSPKGRSCISIRGFRISGVKSNLGGFPRQFSAKYLQIRLREMRKTYDILSIACTATSGFDYGMRSVISATIPQQTEDNLDEACRIFLELDLRKEEILKFNLLGDWRVMTDLEIASNFAFTFHAYTQERACFETNEGRLGLGPEIMQSGDIAVLLFDGNQAHFPFTLRLAGDLWRLMGACYMYDVMAGYAQRTWEESENPAEDFCIY